MEPLQDKPFKCEECATAFRSERQYIRHKRLKHSSNETLSSATSEQTPNNHRDLKNYTSLVIFIEKLAERSKDDLGSNTEQGDIVAGRCEKTLNDDCSNLIEKKLDLQKNNNTAGLMKPKLQVKQHTCINGPAQSEAKEAKFVDNSQSNKQESGNIIHSEDALIPMKESVAGNVLQCDSCGLYFRYAKSLKQHQLSHSESRFKCTLCNVTYHYPQNMRVHMRKKHPDVKGFKCTNAGFIFDGTLDSSRSGQNKREVRLLSNSKTSSGNSEMKSIPREPKQISQFGKENSRKTTLPDDSQNDYIECWKKRFIPIAPKPSASKQSSNSDSRKIIAVNHPPGILNNQGCITVITNSHSLFQQDKKSTYSSVDTRLLKQTNSDVELDKVEREPSAACKTKAFRCGVCDLPFTRLETLHKHLKKFHPEVTIPPLAFTKKGMKRGEIFENKSQPKIDEQNTQKENCSLNFGESRLLLNSNMTYYESDNSNTQLTIPSLGETVTDVSRNEMKTTEGTIIMPRSVQSGCTGTVQIAQDYNNPDVGTVNPTPLLKSYYLCFKCNLCESSFLLPSELRLHLKRDHSFKPRYKTGGHVRSLPHKCELCGAAFDSAHKVHNHKRRIHPTETPIKCSECGESFDTNEARRKHRMEHNGGSFRFQCGECEESFQGKMALAKHRQNKHFRCKHKEHESHACSDDCKALQNAHKPGHFQCKTCHRPYKYLLLLELHEETCTGSSKQLPVIAESCVEQDAKPKVKEFKCKSCDLSFASELKLVDHMNVHTGTKPHKCDICETSYSTLLALKGHQWYMHRSSRYKCDQCPKTFKDKTTFKNHLLKHKGERPFKCSYCDATFLCARDTRQHERLHTNRPAKNHKCDLCFMAFYNKAHLRRHLVTHTKERSFPCQLCHCRFTKKDTLVSHIRYIHEKQTRPKREKKLKCGYCDKCFVQRSRLVIHERHHKNERPFVCPYCPAAYTSRRAAKEHCRSKHSKEVFIMDGHIPCQLCPRTFRSQKDLNSHETLEHNSSQVGYPNSEEVPDCDVSLVGDTYPTSRNVLSATNEEALIPVETDFLDDVTSAKDPQGNTLIDSSIAQDSYMCAECHAMFTDIESIAQHIKTHADISYKCEVCEQVFENEAESNAHVQTHSEDNRTLIDRSSHGAGLSTISNCHADYSCPEIDLGVSHVDINETG